MVHAAFAKIASAEALVDRARAPWLPTASMQAGGSAYATNGQFVVSGLQSASSDEYYFLGQGTLNLQWMLYDFGRTSAAIDAAGNGVNAARLSAQASQQIAMCEAAVAFFTLLADDDLTRSADEVRADRERVVAMTHHLVEAGYRTPVDEMRAQVGLEDAKLEVTLAQATRDNDQVSLASALMLDPATTFRLTMPGQFKVDERAAADGAAAVAARKEVAAAAAHLQQARRDLTAARRGHLPSVSASGQGILMYTHDVSTYSGQSPSTLVTNSPAEVAQGSLTLTIPLFDPLLNANIRAAEGNLGEAQANLEQVTLTTRTQASQAARQMRSARAVLEQSQRVATTTAANLKAVEDRYVNGMESPLALADAQREDAIARIGIIRARLAYDVAAVRVLAGLSRVDDLSRVR